MADATTHAPPAPAARTTASDTTDRIADPEQRGVLEISPRAIERISEVTALQVSAVIRRKATLGRSLPRAKAQLAGRRVRLDIEVAVDWGHPLASVAAEVRGRIARAVEDLTGLVADAVNVDISAVEFPNPDEQTTSPSRRVE